MDEVKSREIYSWKAHKSPQNKGLHFADFELSPSARHWLDWIFAKSMLGFFHFVHSGRWFYEDFQMEVPEWNPEIIYRVVKQMWIYYRIVLIKTVIMVEYQEKATFKIFLCFELFYCWFYPQNILRVQSFLIISTATTPVHDDVVSPELMS